MLSRLRAIRARVRAREDGVEIVAMIIVLPFLIVLILGLVDVGELFATRMQVDNIARDTARRVAADGGDFNPQTNTIGHSWTQEAQAQLVRNGRCVLSLCQPGQTPTIDCSYITPPGGTPPTPAHPYGGQHGETVPAAGWTVSCVVTYPYRAINQTLLNEPVIGMGIGTIIKPFTIVESARSETGYLKP